MSGPVQKSGEEKKISFQQLKTKKKEKKPMAIKSEVSRGGGSKALMARPL